ncbi:dolichyl-phosphate-mannose--protein mannosyltransferase [Agromyces sp. SYSU T00266]|uniref:dolichyl-phosphate-mannose--protein mannosyltransferase n=1 Tax=Agromyces zhanjiangensis TaxID=3158562 RepID=UPI00339331CD
MGLHEVGAGARDGREAAPAGSDGERSATEGEPDASVAAPEGEPDASAAAPEAEPEASVAAAAPAPAREPVGTRLDAWWANLLRTPRRRALWTWGGPIAVTLLAALLRFWNLGHPQAIVFDETYYVKDAWTLLANGYESAWPEGANEDFARGDTDVFSDDPAYVVHPPLGKWMIGLGMALFGADSAFWWRASTALAGTVAVFLMTMVGRRLFRSTLVAVIAGFLLAIDGNAIVMSRVALLDNWVMFFCLLGFWFVLLDRSATEARLRERLADLRAGGGDPLWGPVIWARPWVVAAGVAFGAATAVKWSGLYFIAAFGLYLVLVDAMARRRAGLGFWVEGSLFKQAPATFLLLVPVAGVVYLASWTGWLVTDGGYYRGWADEPGNAATGAWSWVPHSLQSLWHYHQAAYGYHVGVSSPHPWQANPLTWPISWRPTNMYFASTTDGSGGCGQDECWSSIMGIPNPIIWWAATLAAVYLVYRFARYREWTSGVVLVGVAAGYLPWLAYLGRTVFQFYTIAYEPYLLLALAAVIGIVLGRRDAPTWRRQQGIATVAVFLGVAAAVSIFFLPLWTAVPVTPDFRQLHFWLPGWG